MAGKVVIGSDHGGFALKEFAIKLLKDMGYDVEDAGPEAAVSCDYPVYAAKVAQLVSDEKLGILICGTGLGMSMAANKHKGIRAAMCTNEYMAKMARAHNNANILCLGERVIGPGLAEEIIRAFMTTDFEGDRHLRRINLFDQL
ncbi:ribose 5-phosphate isomerase B [Maridesulfovibrio hydrothermalis]|uniref:Putative sugar phosphate isomerase ywlF n=1 Tax=Maridesulfovibrio hydrothermalis AM13 = DSM 14728 TaxID=1121451 RepID=L0RAD0_9BACT|nr:ribose 5-phosphate isomerase B [Maridesulfovibrio hydrothermalis]CCO23172.1 putative sugar phosphate isomerase ywlF [Maridesulfovibrio hydrothermalis AM13 = DSM 14728]